MSKLSEILQKLVLDSQEHQLGLDDNDKINLEEAEAAIKSYILEIIGNKELPDVVKPSGLTGYSTEKLARNQLRAEQRERLES